MATRAPSTPALLLNTAANDTGPLDWTAHPLVRRLLASFATNPAPTAIIPHHERWSRHDTTYCGFRVECLAILRRSIIEPAFLAAQARGDNDAALAIVQAPTVSDAIDSAARLPKLRPITATARRLDPAIWGAAL